MIQKIIKVGHSAAITIPKDFLEKSGFRVGKEVAVEYNDDLDLMIVKPKRQVKNQLINPEFQDWLKEFTTKNKRLLKKLAKL